MSEKESVKKLVNLINDCATNYTNRDVGRTELESLSQYDDTIAIIINENDFNKGMYYMEGTDNASSDNNPKTDKHFILHDRLKFEWNGLNKYLDLLKSEGLINETTLKRLEVSKDLLIKLSTGVNDKNYNIEINFYPMG